MTPSQPGDRSATGRDPKGAAAVPRRCSAWVVIVAALAAGLLAWLAGESIFGKVLPKKVPTPTMGQMIMATSAATEQAATAATALRHNGAFGLLLGLALGAAGGLAGGGRSPRGALLGAVVGAGAGAVVAFLGAVLFFRFRYAFVDELIPSFLYHGATGAAIGAAAGLGLACGCGAGRHAVVRAILGGAIGALLGTVAYEIVGSVLLANSDAGEPVPGTAAARLVARLLVAVAVGLGILAALNAGGRRTRVSAPKA